MTFPTTPMSYSFPDSSLCPGRPFLFLCLPTQISCRYGYGGFLPAIMLPTPHPCPGIPSSTFFFPFLPSRNIALTLAQTPSFQLAWFFSSSKSWNLLSPLEIKGPDYPKGPPAIFRFLLPPPSFFPLLFCKTRAIPLKVESPPFALLHSSFLFLGKCPLSIGSLFFLWILRSPPPAFPPLSVGI